MLTRNFYLEHLLAPGNSGVKTIPLNFTDPISHIDFEFRATNGATSNKENPLLHQVTKIEVVDGGDVITSIRGEVLRGLVSHINGHCPGEYQTEVGGGGSVEAVTLPFGRYRWDTQYALNPAAFRNLQLKISWDLAHGGAIAATKYATGSFKMTVLAGLMEDVSPPVGVLTAKEVYDFVAASSGDEKIELPTDYPYRTLLVRAYENGVDMRATLTNIKLSCDGAKFVAFDDTTADILQAMIDYYGVLHNTRECRFDNNAAVATYMGYGLGGHVTPLAGDIPLIGVNYFWKSDAFMYASDDAGTAITDCDAMITVLGTAYENCYVIPFGRKNEPETWFPASRFKNIDLFLTQKEADGEVQVALQEVRPY